MSVPSVSTMRMGIARLLASCRAKMICMGLGDDGIALPLKQKMVPCACVVELLLHSSCTEKRKNHRCARQSIGALRINGRNSRRNPASHDRKPAFMTVRWVWEWCIGKQCRPHTSPLFAKTAPLATVAHCHGAHIAARWLQCSEAMLDVPRRPFVDAHRSEEH